LEYCDVFEDGFLKSKDLCYKALTRRAVASRGMRNYELALKDLLTAQELIPEEKDMQALLKTTEEDIEMDKRMKRILED
jgi:uncharacterized protein YPO0396